MRHLSKKHVVVEAVRESCTLKTKKDSFIKLLEFLKNINKENIKGKVILSCVNFDTG